MEFKLENEMICCTQTILDQKLEQPVELDFNLPDYCPSIFKILKCQMTPCIMQKYISENKLYIDGVAYIKVIYIDETDYGIRCIDQKIAFSKSAELKGEPYNPLIIVKPVCEFINCRVINPTRIDIRGSISIKAKVISQVEKEILSFVDAKGMQIRNEDIISSQICMCGSKQTSLVEELSLSAGKEPIEKLISCDVCVSYYDTKIIADKVIVKGDIILKTLYTSPNDCKTLHNAEHTIALSQIVDIPGVDESFTCYVEFAPNSVDCEVLSDGNGLSVDIGMNITCSAHKEKQSKIICDAYSIKHDAELVKDNIMLLNNTKNIKDKFISKNSITLDRNKIQRVIEVIPTITNTSVKNSEDKMYIVGNIGVLVIGADDQNNVCCDEKTLPFEHLIDDRAGEGFLIFDPCVSLIATSYNLDSNNNLELRCELSLDTIIKQKTMKEIITQIKIDDENVKSINNKSALTIYFANKGENVWDIAKKYSTVPQSIMEENDLEQYEIDKNCMILIPMAQ